MPAGNILVADDDAAIRTVLNQALSRAGYEVRSTSNAATLWRWVSQGDGDLVDHRRGDAGRERLRPAAAHQEGAARPAGHHHERAEHVHDRGAGVRARRLRVPAEAVRSQGADRDRRARAVGAEGAGAACGQAARTSKSIPLIGRSPAMQEIYRVVARLMQTDLTVMISGESGTGKELVARALHDYGKRRSGAVRRHQHGGDPARSHRVRIVRPREGRLHRRQHPQRRPLRAGRGRHAVPRRDRRHADGGADPALARAAAGRVHHRRRPHPDQDRRAHHRGHQQGSAHPHPAGPVPRGPVLPAQRGAAAAAAVARAHRGRARPDPALLRALVEREGLPAKQLDPAALDRLKRHRWPGNVRELENLARRLAALYPQETIAAAVIDAELVAARHGAGRRGGRAPRRASRPRSSAIWRPISPSFGEELPPPASITGCCARSSIRCCR